MISDEKVLVTRRYTVTSPEVAAALGMKGIPVTIERAGKQGGVDRWVITTSEEVSADD